MNTIELRNISKYFPGVIALNNINFSMHGGRVCALLGENGAGKSTLLKIISGDIIPSLGSLYINGEEKKFKSPKQAIDEGISMIYQERQVLMDLSVAENVFLGMLPTKNGLVDTKTMVDKTRLIINDFGLDIDPNTKVKNLSIAYQQMVEVMKAYNRELSIIAFDEPSTSLSDQEIKVLFRIIKKLKTEGKIIIYVTHRMNEVDEVADDIVVFKDGNLVGIKEQGKVTTNELIKLMVGRDLGNVFKVLKRNKKIEEIVLQVDNLINYKSNNVSFSVHKGEVLGFAGLVGAGRTELIRCIIGADPLLEGKIIHNGKEVKFKSVKDALDNGIVLVSEDRKTQGIIPNLAVGNNITVSLLDRICNKFSFINKKEEIEIAKKSILDFNIRTPNHNKLISELSGGNQQKTLIARAYQLHPNVLILDEPTKGIDVGAKFEIYQMIYSLTDRGIAVIIISSDLPEVIGISDRIIVMREGKISGEILQNQATEEKILNLAMVARKENDHWKN